MFLENAVVTVFAMTADAVGVVSELITNGLEPEHLSVVATDEQSELVPVAYYLEAKHLLKAATSGGCSCLWKTLPGCGVLVCPGQSPILVAGHFALCIARTLDCPALFGDMGPIAAGLYSLGVPQESARGYETAARQGRPLVIVHGRAQDVARARHILMPTRDPNTRVPGGCR